MRKVAETVLNKRGPQNSANARKIKKHALKKTSQDERQRCTGREPYASNKDGAGIIRQFLSDERKSFAFFYRFPVLHDEARHKRYEGPVRSGCYLHRVLTCVLRSTTASFSVAPEVPPPTAAYGRGGPAGGGGLCLRDEDSGGYPLLRTVFVGFNATDGRPTAGNRRQLRSNAVRDKRRRTRRNATATMPADD